MADRDYYTEMDEIKKQMKLILINSTKGTASINAIGYGLLALGYSIEQATQNLIEVAIKLRS
jgi:hypothetical protein